MILKRLLKLAIIYREQILLAFKRIFAFLPLKSTFLLLIGTSTILKHISTKLHLNSPKSSFEEIFWYLNKVGWKVLVLGKLNFFVLPIKPSVFGCNLFQNLLGNTLPSFLNLSFLCGDLFCFMLSSRRNMLIFSHFPLLLSK